LKPKVEIVDAAATLLENEQTIKAVLGTTA